MKYFTLFLLIIFSFLTPQISQAEEIIPVANNQPSFDIDFSKTYQTSSENLLYLLLSAINAHNYSIEEIQFKTGSVLFKAYTKEFIASVCAKDGFNSFIKIVPADNIYNFSPSLLQKLHNYLDVNNSINFQKIL